MLTVLNHHWKRFARDIGKPELGKDPRYNPYYVRWDNRKELEPIIEEWLLSFGSRDEAIKFLVDRHYMAAPVMDLRETVEMIEPEGRGVLQNVRGSGLWRNLTAQGSLPVFGDQGPIQTNPVAARAGQSDDTQRIARLRQG